MRNCQSKTDDYLTNTVKHLRYRVKLMIIMLLLKATEFDDTYCHAYNSLVYYANRYLRLSIPQKKIPESVLLFLLEEEKKSENSELLEKAKQLSDNPLKTLKTFLTPEELKTIRHRLINSTLTD